MSEIVIDGLVTLLLKNSAISWNDARDAVSADSATDIQGSVKSGETDDPAPEWSFARTVMQFDTSVLAGLDILALRMELFLQYPEDIRNVIVHIVDQGTVAGTHPFAVGEYSKIGSISFGSAHFVTGDADAWFPITLSAAAIAALNLAGNTIWSARESNDLDDTPTPIDNTVPYRAFWFHLIDDEEFPGARLVATVPDVPPEPPVPSPTGPIDKTLYLDWTGSAPSATHNWCPNWTTPATSMALSRRSDGSLAVLFGTCDGTGRILRLDSSLHNDDGQAIDSFYQTAFGGGPSGRNSFQYLTTSVKGQGTLNMTAIKPDQVTEVGLRDRGLEDEPLGDQEWSGLRVNGERIAWRFGTSALDAWWKMRKLVAYLVPSAWSRTRGN